MTNIVFTVLALVVSLAAMCYLRNSDPKRRRAHRLPAWQQKRHPSVAWLLSITPGLVLLGLEVYPAFIMWFAAYSLMGWLIALPRPK